MKRRCNQRHFALSILAILAILEIRTVEAQAALGDRVEQGVFKALSTQAQGSNATGFTIKTEQTATYSLRQYVTSGGIVFAVAWNGPVSPQMTDILGSYFSEFETARDQTKRTFGRRSRIIQSDHVIVENWGHMRSLEGRAYDPSLIPTGVSLEDIR